MSKKRIYLRADGSQTQGLGHLYRLLAYAETLRERYSCHFIVRTAPESVLDQISNICDETILLREIGGSRTEAKYLCENILVDNDVVILDGYEFKTEYQKALKKRNIKLISIDDLHDHHYYSDIIINHSGAIKKTDYKTETYTKLYLGPRYALIRPEFRSRRALESQINSEKSIFICLGGADPNNDTLKVLESIEDKTPQAKCSVVLGNAYKYHKEFERFKNNSKLSITSFKSLNAAQMAHEMRSCKVAVTPPSTVAYEYLSIGGELYLHLIADNQKRIQEFLLSEGIALSFSEYNSAPSSRIDQALIKQKLVFDGKSHQRLLEIVES